MNEMKLNPGYAETSTKRNPKCPETIVLNNDIIEKAKCLGAALIDGSTAWLAFQIPGQSRYYFQYRPW